MILSRNLRYNLIYISDSNIINMILTTHGGQTIDQTIQQYVFVVRFVRDIRV